MATIGLNESQNSNPTDEDTLSLFLQEHELHDLYKPLSQNKYKLADLQHLKQDEINELCTELQFGMARKLKFRRLIKLIHVHAGSDGEKDIDNELKAFLNSNGLPSYLHDMLIEEEIQYNHLEIIQPKDIDKICDNHHIKTGIKYNLKTAIDKHQIEKLKEKYQTPGILNKEQKEEEKKDEFPKQKHQKIENKKKKKKKNKKKRKENVANNPTDLDDDKIDDINPDYVMKLVVIGDSAVGKSCLLNKYTTNEYNNQIVSTLGVDFANKYVKLADNSIVKIKIWDTGGQERFKSIARGYYRDADVIILCYGVDSRSSFKNCEKWRLNIIEDSKDDVVLFLVGCKSDINQQRRTVSVEEGQRTQYMHKWKNFESFHWCECSAANGENVKSIFHMAALKVKDIKLKYKLAKQDKQDVPDNLPLLHVALEHKAEQEAEKKSCCY